MEPKNDGLQEEFPFKQRDYSHLYNLVNQWPILFPFSARNQGFLQSFTLHLGHRHQRPRGLRELSIKPGPAGGVENMFKGLDVKT